ncbi:selenocysteine-specific translation elongation factor [Streptomyces vastus]|uniref:Selenocysteine-specific translation elongation factor n=1 Tax=Streptomyces vastus TaxID=285451 RepID=A0ABN3QC28_9ACTN
MAMRVVATAGHVDHGKSTLVGALTGMQTDRLTEEKRRGLSVDLGFAWTRLPSGETVAFVDVPGHRRFVSSMLAGVGAVPAVMFVVAADEGWMPQSDEHLAALDALGVQHGLLAITRSDLADPEEARQEALEKIAATSLGTVESVSVSAPQREGLDQLQQALERMVAKLPSPPADGPVRLWVDRSFTIKGAGTVATGTLQAGSLCLDEELEVAGKNTSVTIRGLQSLGESIPKATALARVAVNLRGARPDDIPRGEALITPGRWLTSKVVDVRLRGEVAEELPLQLVMHIGAAAVPVRVRRLDEETARLTLNRALTLRIGDLALLRNPGAHQIAAGVTVLDVRPPALVRRGAAAARARTLREMTGTPDGAAEVRRRGMVRADELVAMGADVPAPPIAGWVIDPDRWASLKCELEEVVANYAHDHPLDRGIPIGAATRRLELPDQRLVTELVASPMVIREGRILPKEVGPQLPAPLLAAVERLRSDLSRTPFLAPEAGRLEELELNRRGLHAAVRAGALLKVTEGIYLLPEADAEAVRVLSELPQPFTVSQARRALATTRRIAVPLLELLASQGRAERLGNGGHRIVPD